MSEEVQVARIWQNGPHCGFTDLILYQGKWLCSFRESDSHVYGRDGILRVISSLDGKTWESVAEFALDGFDIREARFSIMPDGRLMMAMAGRVCRGGELRWLQSFVTFSRDGNTWSALQVSGPPDVWIWRPCWHEGAAYTWSRRIKNPGETGLNPFYFLRSRDGLKWETIAQTPQGNEASVYFSKDGRAYSLARNENSLIGESAPPYTDWSWHRTGYFIGGPNWIVLSDGRMIAGGRNFADPGNAAEGRPRAQPKMVLAMIDLEKKTYTPTLVLPSGGDCSYPGFVEHGGLLWVSYYSSHEGTTAIYLAKVPLAALGKDISAEIPPSHPAGPAPDFASSSPTITS